MLKKWKRLGPKKGYYVFDYPNGERPKWDFMTKKDEVECEKADLTVFDEDRPEDFPEGAKEPPYWAVTGPEEKPPDDPIEEMRNAKLTG